MHTQYDRKTVSSCNRKKKFQVLNMPDFTCLYYSITGFKKMLQNNLLFDSVKDSNKA